MKIKTLVENTSISDKYDNEHGLSLYIETRKHKLLFDVGASTLFMENAKKMDVDISKVDLVIISHGHYDHGGGLQAFLHANSKAKIYLHQKAFGEYYTRKPDGNRKYIGLDEVLMPNDRFIFTGDRLLIDEELELFSNVGGRSFQPSGNKDLLMEVDSSVVPDDFTHEQNLIIKEDQKIVLAAGCAHHGIVNILDHFRAEMNSWPSHVLGGFHLYNRSANKNEEPAVVEQLAAYLQSTGIVFYTGHCTGIEPYHRLKKIMGENIQYLSTGTLFTI